MPRRLEPDGQGHVTLHDEAMASALSEYQAISADIRELEARKKALREKIESQMLEVGASAVEAGGYRASIYHRNYFGFNETDAEGRPLDPPDIAARRRALRRFFSQYAPDLDIPASDKIAKAWESYLGTLPESMREGTEPPDWLKISKSPTLRISGAGAK